MHSIVSTCLQLGKFRLSLLVLFTTTIGYGLGAKYFDIVPFMGLLVGTLLCSMGANGLNQWWERDRDKKMTRTRFRPLPKGDISPNLAMLLTLSWLVLGLLILFFAVNTITCILGLITSLSYLLLYTPLKVHSPLSILVGAIPGAIPPTMGWTAATGAFGPQAWILFCILYLWQIPHFMSLASIYRQDYLRGGYNLLPDNPSIETITRSIILIFSTALLVISILAPMAGLGHRLFAVVSVIGGGVLLSYAFRLYVNYTLKNAKQVFIVSILYLPLTLSILLLDERVVSELMTF